MGNIILNQKYLFCEVILICDMTNLKQLLQQYFNENFIILWGTIYSLISFYYHASSTLYWNEIWLIGPYKWCDKRRYKNFLASFHLPFLIYPVSSSTSLTLPSLSSGATKNVCSCKINNPEHYLTAVTNFDMRTLTNPWFVNIIYGKLRKL